MTLAGVPLLHDGLRLGPRRADEHVALAPGHRVIATACLLGLRPEEPPPAGAYALGPGTLLRVTGSALAYVDAALAQTLARVGGWHDAAATARALPQRTMVKRVRTVRERFLARSVSRALSR